MRNGKYSILVIDDHPIIHDGLKVLLDLEPDLEVVDAAASATEAMDKLARGLPDLIIIDLSMGDTDGTYLIQRIHAAYPGLKILVYTMSEERLYAERTAAAGAVGYVMKTTPPPLLKEAIRSVLSGNQSFHPDILKRIERKQAGRNAGKPSMLDVLSNREMDVFRLLGEGLDSAAISEKLKISRNTVDAHRINMKNKLDLPNGKALERMAYDVIRQNRQP